MICLCDEYNECRISVSSPRFTAACLRPLVFGCLSSAICLSPFCDFSPIKNPGFLTGVHSISTWRCPTLTWGSPTLPSAFRRFTSEFGMGSGGTTALSPPGLFVLDLRLSFTSSSLSLSSLCFIRTFIGYKLNFYFVSFYFFLFFLLVLFFCYFYFILFCFVSLASLLS